MGTTTESSVRMNLEDLFEMEAQRRADEAAARERAKAEAAAREERERREREEAIRAARDEERARAERELEARNAAVETRIATLREELAQVRAAREETRAQLVEMATRADAPRSGSRGSWLAGAMAAMSLVAALIATFVAWPRPEVHADLPGPVVVAEAPEAPAAPDVVVAEAPPFEEVSVEATPRPTEAAPTRPRPRPRPQPRANDLASQLDFGTGDGLIPE